MKKVVVVISTYNGSVHITRQLDTIFAQEDVEVSVVIRDDFSKDHTIYVLEEYAKLYPKRDITIVKGENVGYAKSFWLALKVCPPADFYAFSDQDDVWKNSKLIRCLSAMKEDASVPQLSYCNMQRSDEKLNRLEEQVEILKPEQLTKKLTLIKTYNYGAATVINSSARDLICRCWPQVEDLPHDMWIGMLCYWFGKVYYVEEELYYWIRYHTSVTGEGTKKTGIIYRIQKSLNQKSYPNVAAYLLRSYSDLLCYKEKVFLEHIVNYKTNLRSKLLLLTDKEFCRDSFMGTMALKIGILCNWF